MVFIGLCSKEIEDLHSFFSDWFNGKNSQDLKRLDRVLASEFTLISPTARQNNKEEVISNIRKGFNSRPNLQIWIENIETKVISQNVYLSTYYELQKHHDNISKRLSTAIFRTNAKCPNSVEWVNVHETWVND